MGGKVWTEKEEKMFWLNIVPQSPKRAGADKVNPEKSWKDLALEMQARLANNAQRKYTALMLFEHFFQNAINRKFSPKARRLAEAYIAKQDPEERQQQKMTRRRLMKSFDSGPSSSESSSGSGSSSTPSPASSGSEGGHEPVTIAEDPTQQVSLPSFNEIATSADGYYEPRYDAPYPQTPYDAPYPQMPYNDPTHYHNGAPYSYGYPPSFENNPHIGYPPYQM